MRLGILSPKSARNSLTPLDYPSIPNWVLPYFEKSPMNIKNPPTPNKVSSSYRIAHECSPNTASSARSAPVAWWTMQLSFCRMSWDWLKKTLDDSVEMFVMHWFLLLDLFKSNYPAQYAAHHWLYKPHAIQHHETSNGRIAKAKIHILSANPTSQRTVVQSCAIQH